MANRPIKRLVVVIELLHGPYMPLLVVVCEGTWSSAVTLVALISNCQGVLPCGRTTTPARLVSCVLLNSLSD